VVEEWHAVVVSSRARRARYVSATINRSSSHCLLTCLRSLSSGHVATTLSRSTTVALYVKDKVVKLREEGAELRNEVVKLRDERQITLLSNSLCHSVVRL
jgi:hypothetical protein